MTNTYRMTPAPTPAARRIAAALFALSLGAGGVFGGTTAYAQTASAGASTATVPATASAFDPALQRMFMALATSVLTNFAASAATGSLDGFDPGPALESALKTALSSRELQTAVDRLVDQAGRGVDGAAADGVSPEMRASMKAALSGTVSMARNEIARELAGPPAAPVQSGTP